MEGDLLRIGLHELSDGLTARVAIRRRPVADPVLALVGEMLGQSLERRMEFERFAPFGSEGREGGVRSIGEEGIVLSERHSFDRPRTCVIDEARVAQSVELGRDLRLGKIARRRARRKVGQLRRIDEDRVDEQAR